MPNLPGRPCPVAGCPHLQPCPVHPKKTRGGTPDGRESAAKRGYDRRWRKLRLMYLRAHPLCETCGDPAIIADHIIPKAAGGEDSWENLQALCQTCHNRKIAQEKQAGLI
jgi:5-methylcytosine-specific restriction protein A